MEIRLYFICGGIPIYPNEIKRDFQPGVIEKFNFDRSAVDPSEFIKSKIKSKYNNITDKSHKYKINRIGELIKKYDENSYTGSINSITIYYDLDDKLKIDYTKPASRLDIVTACILSGMDNNDESTMDLSINLAKKLIEKIDSSLKLNE